MTKAKAIKFEVQYTSPQWPNLDNLINDVIKALEQHTPLPEKEQELSILLTNDEHIQNLNFTYRKINKPTNVLSFAQDWDNPQSDTFVIGDIVLAYETIKREAVQQNKDFAAHFAHLLIHGFLHLLGYDHETEAEAAVMENMEIKILLSMGIKNPYEVKKIVAQ